MHGKEVVPFLVHHFWVAEGIHLIYTSTRYEALTRRFAVFGSSCHNNYTVRDMNLMHLGRVTRETSHVHGMWNINEF
jgi:hypothetical protein